MIGSGIGGLTAAVELARRDFDLTVLDAHVYPVGGLPQTTLLQNWGPRISKDVWMVGDSIFPGQSVPATALGGLRVAKAISSFGWSDP